MIDSKRLREIEQYFHEQIPLTRAMGVRVESYDGERLVLAAPLALNYNHIGTAFGGSLSAIATLAGYGLLWLELGDRESHVIISKSAISFLRPVRGEIRAICRRPAEKTLEAFRRKFARNGRARIKLGVTIEQDGETAVDFEGIFVARK